MSISREEAESFIRKHLEIKDSLRNSGFIDQLQNETARAYYSSEYISFVFEKYRVDELFTDNPGADALRVYYGAHDSGEPTIVLVAAHLNVNNTKVMNSSAPKPGQQWPGFKGSSTGGGGITGFDLEKDSIY